MLCTAMQPLKNKNQVQNDKVIAKKSVTVILIHSVSPQE